ncbi:RRQRL motif-containing zinc-binding protein [Nonomuraea sp. NPDC048882]|uniref:RRQRL motif-containing zinc-binding protein n=1 Tax=Nonomuraea sp. NPDC048882 TaxID=3154347 RepID=UPI0033C233A1
MSKARLPFWDPSGSRHGGLPTYPWQMAPPGLATKRQLAADGLRPGGQPVCAQVMWRTTTNGGRAAGVAGNVGVAYLYDRALAKPKRKPSPAQLEAIAKALRARRLCPQCGIEKDYCLPKRYGVCLDCHEQGQVGAHPVEPSRAPTTARSPL